MVLGIFSLVETISLESWETSLLACQIFTSGFRKWLKNVTYLKGGEIRDTETLNLSRNIVS